MGYTEYYGDTEAFDITIEEFKNLLRKSVKQEIQEYIESLEKENEELKYIKENWDKLQMEYADKKRELQLQLSTCKAEAARMRLADLFKESGMMVILYRPKWEVVYKPKCDKCDADRYLHFKSPSGKDYKEKCECSKSYMRYKPEVNYCVEFRYTGIEKNPILMWYAACNREGNSYELERSNLLSYVYDGTAFETVMKEYNDNVYFKNPKECQEYCNYINTVNHITDDMTTKENND